MLSDRKTRRFRRPTARPSYIVICLLPEVCGLRIQTAALRSTKTWLRGTRGRTLVFDRRTFPVLRSTDHSFTLSLEARNLPFQQILPTLILLVPLNFLHGSWDWTGLIMLVGLFLVSFSFKSSRTEWLYLRPYCWFNSSIMNMKSSSSLTELMTTEDRPVADAS